MKEKKQEPEKVYWYQIKIMLTIFTSILLSVFIWLVNYLLNSYTFASAIWSMFFQFGVIIISIAVCCDIYDHRLE